MITNNARIGIVFSPDTMIYDIQTVLLVTYY